MFFERWIEKYIVVTSRLVTSDWIIRKSTGIKYGSTGDHDENFSCMFIHVPCIQQSVHSTDWKFECILRNVVCKLDSRRRTKFFMSPFTLCCDIMSIFSFRWKHIFTQCTERWFALLSQHHYITIQINKYLWVGTQHFDKIRLMKSENVLPATVKILISSEPPTKNQKSLCLCETWITIAETNHKMYGRSLKKI